MIKGVLLVLVSVLQLPNNLGLLVKPERKELKFSIFSLLFINFVNTANGKLDFIEGKKTFNSFSS